MNCPTCGNELIKTHEAYMNSTLCEEVLECPNGCYEEQYAYGATRILRATWWQRWWIGAKVRLRRLWRYLLWRW